MAAAGRTRNFAFIVYPDSAPADWIEILKGCLIQMFISPLHSPVINDNDEHERKAHYHVLIMFDNVKTLAQAEEISHLVNGTNPIMVNSLRSYARYLCHLDNPDKEQFGSDACMRVISTCGADYYEVISLNTDRLQVIHEMIVFVENYDIVSFYILAKYAAEHNDSWHRALTTNCTVYMKHYLQSRLWSKERGLMNLVDENGEVIV